MAEFTMQNEKVIVKIDEHASEITSFFNKESNLEHMWQGDPTYWKGKNPTLFPMVGKVFDGNIKINGNVYHMGNHGFTRNADFKCIEHDESHIVMELKDSKETLEQYPFHFELRICYTLKGNQLNIDYTIKNNNDCVMPFNFGLHPAFNCPLELQYKYEDYFIEVDHKEDLKKDHVKQDTNGNLVLDEDDLQTTIILNDPKSTKYDLTTKDHTHGTIVEASNYPWVAFWSPRAPFVCIEPWYSHTDFKEVNVPFDKREGTLHLDANCEWKTTYSIIIY